LVNSYGFFEASLLCSFEKTAALCQSTRCIIEQDLNVYQHCYEKFQISYGSMVMDDLLPDTKVSELGPAASFSHPGNTLFFLKYICIYNTKFEILASKSNIVVSWFMTPVSLVGSYQRFEGTLH
jgi:hypothetical protein